MDALLTVALSPLVTVLLGAEKTILLSIGLAGHSITGFSGPYGKRYVIIY